MGSIYLRTTLHSERRRASVVSILRGEIRYLSQAGDAA